MNADQFRAAAHSAVDEIIEYFNTLPSRRVVPNIEPGYLRPLLPSSAPTDPEPWSQIQPDMGSKIIPGLTHWQSPNFMAFFPAGVTYPSILGEMYSAAFTAPAFNWLCSPVCTELEVVVLDWLGQALGLPACFLSTGPTRGGGVIQGSASEAVTTVIVAARERHVREKAEAEGLKEGTKQWEDRTMELRPKLVALGSDQAHSCVAKGARIAGTRYRSIPTRLEDDMELTGEALRTVLEECEGEGLEPFYLATTMGTTNTCAIDRFAEIKSVLQEKKEWQRIWVHVDAAYAGAALVMPEWQYIAKEWAHGIDSFNVNMSKWLLVNFDASCLFVRNQLDLTSALDITPSYMRNPFSEKGIVTDYRNWQIPLGRRFRALKIWFVMRTYGLSGIRSFIHKGIQHGEIFSSLVRTRPDLFHILTPPAFGLTVFRIRAPAEQAEARGTGPVIDASSAALTRAVAEKINDRGEIFLTSSVVAGRFVIRVVSTNPLAEEKYVRRAFEILAGAADEVVKGGGDAGGQAEDRN